jgi:hypothetical protein
MVTVLRIAAHLPCAQELGHTLLQQAHTKTFPDVKALQSRYLPETDSPVISPRQHAITDYDALLTGCWNDRFQAQQELAHVS